MSSKAFLNGEEKENNNNENNEKIIKIKSNN